MCRLRRRFEICPAEPDTKTPIFYLLTPISTGFSLSILPKV